MRNADQLNAIKELVYALLEKVESLTQAQDHAAALAEAGEGEQGFYQMIEAYEKFLIRRALARACGQQAGAARLLGLKPTTLHYKMKAYDISAGAEPEGGVAGARPGTARRRAQGAP